VRRAAIGRPMDRQGAFPVKQEELISRGFLCFYSFLR
jgi:hypothetical protein